MDGMPNMSGYTAVWSYIQLQEGSHYLQGKFYWIVDILRDWSGKIYEVMDWSLKILGVDRDQY